VDISGKLTSTGNSAVSGNATGSGTGVSLSGNITDGNISGSATGSGTGVNISGSSALNNTTVSGSGVDGAGVDISGKLTSTGNSAVSGNATGSGAGVNINGTVSGGQISGNSAKEYAQDVVQQRDLQTLSALGATRSEGSDVLETSGYRPKQHTQTISVCDEENNCTLIKVSPLGADVQEPDRHTNLVTAPLSSGSTKKR
ncbi:hypothetical protein, partial [Cronobacter dublinensis]